MGEISSTRCREWTGLSCGSSSSTYVHVYEHREPTLSGIPRALNTGIPTSHPAFGIPSGSMTVYRLHKPRYTELTSISQYTAPKNSGIPASPHLLRVYRLLVHTGLRVYPMYWKFTQGPSSPMISANACASWCIVIFHQPWGTPSIWWSFPLVGVQRRILLNMFIKVWFLWRSPKSSVSLRINTLRNADQVKLEEILFDMSYPNVYREARSKLDDSHVVQLLIMFTDGVPAEIWAGRFMSRKNAPKAQVRWFLLERTQLTIRTCTKTYTILENVMEKIAQLVPFMSWNVAM